MKGVKWGLFAAALMLFGAWLWAGSPGIEVRLVGGAPEARAVATNQMDQLFTQTVEKVMPGMVMILAPAVNPVGVGTGSIVRIDGKFWIVSNKHVVWDDKGKKCYSEVEVHLSSRDHFRGQVAYCDPLIDASVIIPSVDTVLGRPLPTIAVGDPWQVQVGQWVMAVGNPKGLQNSASAGIISAYRPEGRGQVYFQTDAAINPGNSGGPLVNMDGQVIAMNTMKLVDASLEGLGFAIPIDVVIARIPRGGSLYQAPMLGVHVEELDADRARGMGVHPGAIAVTKIEPGSAAEAAGIQPGDIFISCDKGSLAREAQLWHYLATKWTGDTASFTIMRRGQNMNLTVNLGRQGAVSVTLQGLGLQCEAGQGGVVVKSVARPSPAANAGIQQGNVIVAVGANQASLSNVSSPNDLQNKLKGIAASQNFAMVEVVDGSGAHRFLQLYFQ